MKISHLLRILHSLDLLSVGGDILETLGVVDGEHDEESLAGPHVLVPHGAVLLLARRVQDVQQTRLSVNDDLLPIAVLNGRIVLVNKMVLNQLNGQSTLSHTSGSDNNQLVLRHFVPKLFSPVGCLNCAMDTLKHEYLYTLGFKYIESLKTHLVDGQSIILQFMLKLSLQIG